MHTRSKILKRPQNTKAVVALIISVILPATPALSDESIDESTIEITANVRLVSDYVFRGITQSNRNPAIQGGVDARFPKNIYAGAFLSNVENLWGNVYNQIGGEEDFEYDVYLGYLNSFAIGQRELQYDIGLIQYAFEPDPDGLTWGEAYIGVSAGGLSARYSSAISGAPMGDYIEMAYRGNFLEMIDYRFHIGHYFLDRTVRGLDEYTDMSLGVSKDIGRFTIGLTYFRNDRDGRERFQRPANDRLVLSLGTFFAPGN